MPRKSAARLTRIAITTVLVIYVFHKAGLLSVEGWQDLFDNFAHVNLLFLTLSIGIGLINILASAFKWYMLAHSRGLQVSLWRLYAYYTIGKFFNLILPTSMGGDVVRIHKLGRYTGRYPDATASVFVERFSGMAIQVLLALLAIGVNLHLFNQPWLMIGVCLAVGGAVALICWSLLDERLLSLIRQIFGISRVSLFSKLLTKIEKFRQAVLAYEDDPRALWGAIINSLIFYFLAVVNVWVSALAFGSDLSFLTMLTAVPIILLLMNLPISIGGIGLMEFAYSFTLGLFGATPTLAISTALLIRAKSFLYAGLGGLLYSLVSDGVSVTQSSLAKVANEYKQNLDE